MPTTVAPHLAHFLRVGSRRIGSPCDWAIRNITAAFLAPVSAMSAASGSSPTCHVSSASWFIHNSILWQGACRLEACPW